MLKVWFQCLFISSLASSHRSLVCWILAFANPPCCRYFFFSWYIHSFDLQTQTRGAHKKSFAITFFCCTLHFCYHILNFNSISFLLFWLIHCHSFIICTNLVKQKMHWVHSHIYIFMLGGYWNSMNQRPIVSVSICTLLYGGNDDATIKLML